MRAIVFQSTVAVSTYRASGLFATRNRLAPRTNSHSKTPKPPKPETPMGRPRLSVKRDRQFGVRLTDAEASAIEAAASRRGQPPVVFIRSVAIEVAAETVPEAAAAETVPEAAAAETVPEAAAEAIARVNTAAAETARRAELRRIGVNLNQVVRHLHEGRGDLDTDLDTLRKLVKEVRDQLANAQVANEVAS